MNRRRFLASLGLTPSLFTGCTSPSLEPYPNRDVKMVVQAAPGGLSDTVSRIIASQMESTLGVPVVCENKPGAAGALAFSFVSRRPPDGYTLGHAPVELAILKTLGYTSVSPETVDPLCLVSKTRPALAVAAASPFKDFASFLSGVRERPGHFIAGNSGTGSIWHLNALLMEQALGLKLLHVPFGGSSATITNLMGRHIDLAVMGVGEAVPQVDAGSLRVLAVFDQDRTPLLPQVPAVRELGYSFGANAWSGFFGPKGIPAPAKELLATAFRKAFESDLFQKVCKDRGMEAFFLPESEFTAFAKQQARFFDTRVPQLLSIS
ncbi:MAG: tripartite tricarboxylate transporter substrate binding protein [Bryobacterales bacterium]|nr:tripartite tricarboxylate transporter substrate binding protein [Bryobacterales bacterium]